MSYTGVAIAMGAVMAQEAEYRKYLGVCKELGVKPRPRPKPIPMTKETKSGMNPIWCLVAFLFGMSL